MRFSLLAAIFFVGILEFGCALQDEDSHSQDFADRMDRLNRICAQEGFVRLDKLLLEDYLEWSSRNYSFLLLFVTLADQRCEICQQVVDELAIFGKSLRLAGIADLFVGVVDYDQTPEIFYRLRVRRIPSVVLVAADHQLSSAKAAPRMDLQNGYSAEAISEWLASVADWRLKIVRPPDYQQVYRLVAAGLAVVALLPVAWKLRHRIYLSNLAALVATVFCSLMVSGHMFNRIHETPLFHRSQRGLSVISQESSFQFGCETYLIGAMHLGFGGCVIVVVDRRMRRNSAGNATIAAALLLAALFYTFVVSSFRFKLHVYPFSGLVNVERYF